MINMYRLLKYLLPAVFPAFFVACDEAVSPVAPELPLLQNDSRPIGFAAKSSAVSGSGGHARSVLVDQRIFDKAGSEFLVFADYYHNPDADGNYRDVTSVFSSQPVVSDGTLWSYSPLRFWEASGAYDFRAVWPSSARALKVSNGRMLAVNYSLFQDDCDLMVAYRHREMSSLATEGQVVGLNFNHALSAVNVVVKKEADDTQRYILKKIFFKNIWSVGVLAYDAGELTAEEEAAGTSVAGKLSDCWSLVYRDYTSEVGVYAYDEEITDAGSSTHYSFMLPQDLANKIEIATPPTLIVVIEVNGQEAVSEIPLHRTSPSMWVAGTLYTYGVTIKKSGVALEVVTTQWDEVSGTADDIVGYE